MLDGVVDVLVNGQELGQLGPGGIRSTGTGSPNWPHPGTARTYRTGDHGRVRAPGTSGHARPRARCLIATRPRDPGWEENPLRGLTVAPTIGS